jgi:hypothetical protein
MNEDRRLEILAGRWWRWDSYEFRDGCIAPSTDANLSFYDTFAGRDGSRSRSQPYNDLLAAIDGLHFEVEPGSEALRLDGPEPSRVLEWCAEYGLLGVLPHRVNRLTMATRWQRDSWAAPPGMFVAAERHVEWHSTGWSESIRARLDVREDESNVREGELVDESLLSDESNFGVSEAVILNNSGELVVERLHQSVSRFFPAVTPNERDTFAYPQIASDRFWTAYAEPVDQFLNAAFQIRDAVTGLAGVRELETMGDEDALVVKRGIDRFNAMLRQATLAVIPTDKGIQRRWVPKSLIAAFALMITEDLELEHGRALRCENCGRPFVGLSYQATYCSTKCRKTAQMRRYRQRYPGGADAS